MTGTLPDLTLTSHFVSGDADLSQYVRDNAFNISRGSSQQSATSLIADEGSFTATLTNTDRQFDPTFTSGPHFGELLPGVPMDFVATWDGTDYPLFSGANTQWPQIYPNQRVDQITSIACADGQRFYARAEVTDIFPKQLTGDRIAAVNDAIGSVVGGSVSIADGTAYVPFTGDGTSASNGWTLMADACSAEWGALFVDASGVLRFFDRPGIAAAGSWATPQAVFGDAHDGIELPFFDVIPNFDDVRIVNDATNVYNQFGSKAHAEDLSYVGDPSKPWGKHTWSQSFPMSSGALARSYVHEIVRRFADPTVRIDKLVIKPQRAPDLLWPVVLSLELGQQITVRVTPQGGGTRIEQTCYIQHIQHDYSSGGWQTTYDLNDSSLVTINAFVGDGHLMDGTTMLSF